MLKNEGISNTLQIVFRNLGFVVKANELGAGI